MAWLGYVWVGAMASLIVFVGIRVVRELLRDRGPDDDIDEGGERPPCPPTGPISGDSAALEREWIAPTVRKPMQTGEPARDV